MGQGNAAAERGAATKEGGVKVADPYKRHKTRHRGVTYRARADGSRAYSVWAGGRFVSVDGGESAAVTKQAELRGRIARGEKITKSTARFAIVAEQWFESKRKLRPWTRGQYRAALDLYLLPRYGSLKLAQVTPDRVAVLVRELEAKGLSGAYVQNILKPLNGTMNFAVRKGMLSTNPVALLTPDERPTVTRGGFRELGPEDVQRLLTEAARYEYGPLVRSTVYSGLRLGEALGLQWGDIDFDGGLIHVTKQWTREGELAEPKTTKAVRRVVMPPDLVTFLREHREHSFAKGRAKPEDFVFASRVGTPLGHRNVCRAFTRIVERAGLAGEPTLTFHGLRHLYASLMIERGISSTVLADQMGHSSSTITEARYIHLWNRVRTDDAVRDALQEAMQMIGKNLASTGGNQRESQGTEEPSKVASLRAFAPAGSA